MRHRCLLHGADARRARRGRSEEDRYLEAEDLVFVLDVNGDFGPWLVSGERLFRAMDSIDSSSGKKRGLLVFE